MISITCMRRAVVCAAISVSLIAVGAAITATNALEKCRKLENEKTLSEVLKVVEADESFYIKEYGEIIGVFDSNGELLYTVEVYIKTLPAPDRALLKKGIAAAGSEELYKILGDYDS